MVCIYCGAPTSVANSRLQRRNNHIWRRRRCSACTALFTTIEHTQLDGAFMVEHPNGTQTALSRDRLFIDVYESCKHRPTALKDAAFLTDIILERLLTLRRGGVIGRRDIVQTAHTILKRFDATAAAVYMAYHPALAVA